MLDKRINIKMPHILVMPLNIKSQMSQASPSPSPSSSVETSNLYMALVGMSDAFLAKKQPRLAIHCLESIIAVKSQDISIATSLHVQLRTRLNLCRLYLDYTVNTNQVGIDYSILTEYRSYSGKNTKISEIFFLK